MENEKRLIWDEDAQHRLVALAVKRQSDYIPLDMITYILFNDTPAVDAIEVVYGKWKLNKDGSATCSHCHRTTRNAYDQDNWFRYCPDCGSRMIEVY